MMLTRGLRIEAAEDMLGAAIAHWTDLYNGSFDIEAGAYAVSGGLASLWTCETSDKTDSMLTGRGGVLWLKIESNILSKGNIFNIMSKKLKIGLRIDKSHHEKPSDHIYFGPLIINLVIGIGNFISPNFSTRNLELRVDGDGIVFIYYNKQELLDLITICSNLLNHPGGHVHLEDQEILTSRPCKISERLVGRDFFAVNRPKETLRN